MLAVSVKNFNIRYYNEWCYTHGQPCV